MANKNKTICECTGIYNESTGYCDDPMGIDPCPSWFATTFQNAQSWDWQNISNTGLEWAYVLGLAERPVVNTPDNSGEMETTKYITYGIIALTIIVLVVFLIRKKK